ncbi:MAG: class I SAM-dependent methyltransferase [Pseudomonadales bacterium]|nr:class I SAM-dependent methyltransferase [Pseudomonadales bacterium]
MPFSQACENNKRPILQYLQSLLADSTSVLEIGGGTGQHAVFFAENLPHLHWQSSDIPEHVASLTLRIQHAALQNVPAPIALDVNDQPWSCDRFDAVFTANSFHIMSADSVATFFSELPNHLSHQAKLIVYGPFRYQGDYTTESNARFDQWLKDRDSNSGIRDFEWVNKLAQTAGLKLSADYGMPANNQLLVWQTDHPD